MAFLFSERTIKMKFKQQIAYAAKSLETLGANDQIVNDYVANAKNYQHVSLNILASYRPEGNQVQKLRHDVADALHQLNKNKNLAYFVLADHMFINILCVSSNKVEADSDLKELQKAEQNGSGYLFGYAFNRVRPYESEYGSLGLKRVDKGVWRRFL